MTSPLLTTRCPSMAKVRTVTLSWDPRSPRLRSRCEDLREAALVTVNTSSDLDAIIVISFIIIIILMIDDPTSPRSPSGSPRRARRAFLPDLEGADTLAL